MAEVRRIGLLVVLVGMLLPVSGYTSDRAEQRKLFLEAHKAIKQGAITRYNKISTKISDINNIFSNSVTNLIF